MASRPRGVRLALTPLLGLLIAALAAPPGAVGQPVQGRQSVALATHVRITHVKSTGITVPRTAGSVGLQFVVRGRPVHLRMTFLDSDNQPAPLSTSGFVTVHLRIPRGVNKGFVGIRRVDAWDRFDTFTSGPGFRIRPANNVRIRARATVEEPDGDSRVIRGTSRPFDVQSAFTLGQQGQALTQIGGTSTGRGCDATSRRPTCADLMLPNGSTTSILMSLGLCPRRSCTGSVVQALAGMGKRYTRNAPGTLVVKCDKTLCGGGAIHDQRLTVQLTPRSRPRTAPACPAKGRIGARQAFCVDYVQSKRANAGDTFLYLLFFRDVRAHYT